jgi:hypothetical protein
MAYPYLVMPRAMFHVRLNLEQRDSSRNFIISAITSSNDARKSNI